MYLSTRWRSASLKECSEVDEISIQLLLQEDVMPASVGTQFLASRCLKRRCGAVESKTLRRRNRRRRQFLKRRPVVVSLCRPHARDIYVSSKLRRVCSTISAGNNYVKSLDATSTRMSKHLHSACVLYRLGLHRLHHQQQQQQQQEQHQTMWHPREVCIHRALHSFF